MDGFYFKIGAGGVIRGWDVGFLAMSIGEEGTLTIRQDYGYGAQGAPPTIPGGATLIFDVQLLNAKSMTEGELYELDKKVANLRR